jgi:hypothetical protein
VNAPIELVFERLTDWQSQGEWMLGTHIEMLSPPPPDTLRTPQATNLRTTPSDTSRIGEKFRAFTGIGPLGFWDYMTVTRWEPPYKVDVVHTGNVVRGLGFMHLTAQRPDITKFEWSEEIELPLGVLGRIGWPVVRPFFLAGIRHSLHKFAKYVESHARRP